MADNIFTDPQPDRFEHESPLRAFTEWQSQPSGIYAVGKGFRPSVVHLVDYLDAIERKEGWRLVQIMYADDPDRRSMIFRRASMQQLALTVDTKAAQDALLDTIGEAKAFSVGEIFSPEPEDDGFVTVAGVADDPVNPKHYGGTACAELGELLTPNAYQTLKYCWRLGEKDDPVIELKKAIWYWEREIALYADVPALPALDHDCHGFLEGRIADRSEFTRNITRQLFYGFNIGMRPDHRRAILDLLQNELGSYESGFKQADRGRGQEP